MDVNQATFTREAEQRIADEGERKRAIAQFAKLQTADDRAEAFRRLRGGSMTKSHATKLGSFDAK